MPLAAVTEPTKGKMNKKLKKFLQGLKDVLEETKGRTTENKGVGHPNWALVPVKPQPWKLNR